MQRLQHAGERDRAAVRVGDDAVVLERAPAVHLGHDERDPGLEPVGRRLVDRDRAAAHGVRHELARRARADREEEDVDVAARERLGRRLLDRAAPSCLPGRARRGEDAHVARSRAAASSSSVTVPTAPVAPTTPMRALRELEGIVEGADGGVDLVGLDVAGDLDRRGGDDGRGRCPRPRASRTSSRRRRGGSSCPRRSRRPCRGRRAPPSARRARRALRAASRRSSGGAEKTISSPSSAGSCRRSRSTARARRTARGRDARARGRPSLRAGARRLR